MQYTQHLTQSDLLTRKQAAEYLGLKSSTLAVWACNKRYDLPMIKIGRLVKYKLDDLDKFIAHNTVDFVVMQ